MMEIMMMEIMVSCRWRRWSWRPEDGDQKEQNDIGHIMSLFDCMWCLSCFASCLLRTTVVNKMIAHNNFKKVFPLTVHRCEGSLFRSTTWWSGVIDSNVRIQRVLTSLACTDMASEHKRPKGRTWVVWKIRSTWRCSPMMTSPSHVMIGHGLVWLGSCIT